MTIELFTCSSEKHRINKRAYISNRFTLQGTLKENTSVTNPKIMVEKTNPVLYNYNYMYIAEFDRWYFITDIVNVYDKMWIIEGHVDVLYSFSGDIYKTKAVIDKAENGAHANVYMNDGSFVMDSRKFNQVIPFPNGLSENGQFILICAGGQGGGN